MLRGYVCVPIQYLSYGLCVYSYGLRYFTRSAQLAVSLLFSFPVYVHQARICTMNTT
jgi:hypothetical protein